MSLTFLPSGATLRRCAPLLVVGLAVAAAQPAAGAPRPVDRPLPGVTAVLETPAVFDDDDGGNADADDPAIWVHPQDPKKSLVLGTLKNGGLAVYDLAGRQLQRIATPSAPTQGAEPGRFNNVDVALGVRIGRSTRDLAVVSDRGRDRIRSYRINPRGSAAGAGALTDVTAPEVAPVFSANEAAVDEQATAYGLATTVEHGIAYVVTSRRHETALAMLRLEPRADGSIGYRRLAATELPTAFTLPGGARWEPCEEPGERPQVEGMTIDAAHGVLYAAQEDIGVWRIDLSRKGFGRRHLIERTREFGVPATFDADSEECVPSGPDPGAGGRLAADAEGLTIADEGHGRGRLLASSQGDSTFAVYDRGPGNRYLGGFAVVGKGTLDGAEHSDGAAVVTVPLGRAFPRGLLVVHDGEGSPTVLGEDGEPRTSTNFHFVRWDAVVNAVVGADSRQTEAARASSVPAIRGSAVPSRRARV